MTSEGSWRGVHPIALEARGGRIDFAGEKRHLSPEWVNEIFGRNDPAMTTAARRNGGVMTGKALLRKAALLAAVSLAGSAEAQTFNQYFAFGDSYADTGNALKLVSLYAPALLPQFLALYPTGRFSGGTNYVDDLSAHYGLNPINYAIGGAQTGSGNELGFPAGFAQEIQQFEASGQKIGPDALLTLNIGANDARDYYQSGGSLAGVPAASTQSATQAMSGVNALVAAGAKTIVFSVGNVAGLPESTTFSASQVAVGSAYSTAYNADMQQSLAALHAQGVNVVWVDMTLMLKQIEANLTAYGFSSFVCTTACVGNPTLQAQNLFYVDGIHLTSAGFQVLANYIESELAAPLSLPAAGGVGLSAAQGFAGSLFARLDLINPPTTGSAALGNGDALPTHKAPAAVNPPGDADRWSVFMQGVGGAGSQASTSTAAGYNWSSLGGEFGLEYRVSPEIVVGGALQYAEPRLSLSGGMGSTTVDSWQGAIYGGYTGRNLFFEGLLAGGQLDYSNRRPGVIGDITSSPRGDAFVVAAKAGYLFDLDPTTKLGPIGGLSFAHVGLNAYTEAGDPALTLAVASQSLDSTLGSLGAQARKSFATPAGRFDAFLNLTAEENFSGASRGIDYSQTSAPLIVDTLQTSGAGQHVFARVAAGVSSNLTDRLSLSASVSQTAWQPGGQDFSATAAIKLSF